MPLPEVAERDPEAKALFQLTREMELLISAALVFALLQLPSALDEWWWSTSVHIAGSAFFSVFLFYYVGKLVAYGLIVAISAHFLLRGFWVAIMSLRSVYPAIDRDKLDQGTIYRRFYEERLLSLQEIEDRVDRVAASIFAFVFLFLLLFLMMAVWAAGAWGVAFAIAKITGNPAVTGPIVIGMFVLYLGLASFVALVDKISKKRPVPERWERAALRVQRWMYYVTFNFLYAPVFFTFASNTSRRRMSILLVAFLYSMIGVFMVSIFHTRGVIGFDSYSYYPAQAREQQLRAIHYDNLRNEELPSIEPAIQSEMIDDPYLRLFIPYDAREDNERIRALCPEVAPLRSEGFFFAKRGKLPKPRVDAVSACFDRLNVIELDGKRLANPGFVFYRQPRGKVPGRLALIPIESLAAGRHLLTVKSAPLPGKKDDPDADEFYIPFWK